MIVKISPLALFCLPAALLTSKVKSPSHFFRSHGQSAGVGGLGKTGEGVGVNCGNLGGFWAQRFSMRH